MLLLGLPGGRLPALLSFIAVIAVMFGLGGAIQVRGRRGAPSYRELIALGAGSIVGVALGVTLDVAGGSGFSIERAGDVWFGTIGLGVYVAAAGWLSWMIGAAVGRTLRSRNR